MGTWGHGDGSVVPFVLRLQGQGDGSVVRQGTVLCLDRHSIGVATATPISELENIKSHRLSSMAFRIKDYFHKPSGYLSAAVICARAATTVGLSAA